MPHSRIMLEIGPGPLSHSAQFRSTQDPTGMSSISNTSQRKRRGDRGSGEGDRNNCLLGLLPKIPPRGQWLLGPLLFSCTLMSWISDCRVTKTIAVSLGYFQCCAWRAALFTSYFPDSIRGGFSCIDVIGKYVDDRFETIEWQNKFHEDVSHARVNKTIQVKSWHGNGFKPRIS